MVKTNILMIFSLMVIFLFVFSACSKTEFKEPIICSSTVTCEEGFEQREIGIDDNSCPVFECVEGLMLCGEPVICDDGSESLIAGFDDDGCAIFEC
jgi:hypothetical protein